MSAPRPMLVCVYLRGAADGLSLVPPYFEDRYYRLRPTLGVPRPDDSHSKKADRAIDLDGRFGLHPSLAALEPIYRANELAIIHAVGSDDQTRSHFEAQDRMEHAGPKDQALASGWLARHLTTRRGGRPGTLSAVALGTKAPESLRGCPTSVLESASEYRLGDGADEALADPLAALYSGAGSALPLDEELRAAGREALDTLDRIRALDAASARGAKYPEGQLGDRLREIARFVRGDLGVEVACADYDGWDTHFVSTKLVPDLARHLADSLAAFRTDIGDAASNVVVVCMTEFGRRAYENTSLGTDHGRAGVMFVMGGGVRGGRVITDWPGLRENDLEPPGDLRVTIDYRDVLKEILRDRFGNTRTDEVFPGTGASVRGLFV